jgi:hypothetical protein
MNFITKKNVLLVSSVFALALVAIVGGEALELCNRGTLCDRITDSFGPFSVILLIVPLLFPFSLITYRMKEEVFQRWIRFAVWYIPLLIIGYFIYPQGGGLMASSFDALVFILFISIFVITSTVKIVRAHKSSR